MSYKFDDLSLEKKESLIRRVMDNLQGDTVEEMKKNIEEENQMKTTPVTQNEAKLPSPAQEIPAPEDAEGPEGYNACVEMHVAKGHSPGEAASLCAAGQQGSGTMPPEASLVKSKDEKDLHPHEGMFQAALHETAEGQNNFMGLCVPEKGQELCRQIWIQSRQALKTLRLGSEYGDSKLTDEDKEKKVKEEEEKKKKEEKASEDADKEKKPDDKEKDPDDKEKKEEKKEEDSKLQVENQKLKTEIADFKKRMDSVTAKRQRDSDNAEEVAKVLRAKIVNDAGGLIRPEAIKDDPLCKLQAMDDILTAMRDRTKKDGDSRLRRFPDNVQVDDATDSRGKLTVGRKGKDEKYRPVEEGTYNF